MIYNMFIFFKSLLSDQYMVSVNMQIRRFRCWNLDGKSAISCFGTLTLSCLFLNNVNIPLTQERLQLSCSLLQQLSSLPLRLFTLSAKVVENKERE